VRLLCHHYVREDTQRLYGFLSSVERDIFRQLINISNIGPKTAIGILSGITPGDLVACVNKGDSSRLRKVPGVGDKTAQRLIVELKGKLASVSAPADAEDGGAAAGPPKIRKTGHRPTRPCCLSDIPKSRSRQRFRAWKA